MSEKIGTLSMGSQDLQALRRRLVETEHEVEELRRNNEYLKTRQGLDASVYAVIDAALDAVIMIDQQGEVVAFNPVAERVFGYKRETVLGKPIADFIIPPYLREAHQQGIVRYLASGEARILGHRTEVPALHANGTEFPVELAIAPLELDGRTFFTAYLRDISAQKKAEETLRESESRFRTLFEGSPDPVFVADFEGYVQDVNPAACRLQKMDRDTLVGKHFSELVAPALREESLHEFAKLIRGNINPLDGACCTSDGTVVPIEIRSSRITYGGQPAVLLHVRDITERRNLEIQLRAQKNHLRSIVESEPECVKTLTRDGRLIDMNPAGLAMIEADSLEQVQGTTVVDLLLPAYRRAFEDLLRRVYEGESGILEFEIQGLKGTRRWMETHAAPLHDFDGKVSSVLAVTRDISVHKQSEQALIEAKEQAEEMSRLKSAFLNNMSHEIRTPLTAILGFSNILAEEATEGQKELVDMISQSGRRLLSTLNAVLDLSMLEAGSLTPESAWIEVVDVVQCLVETAQADVREKGIELVLNTSQPHILALLDRTCLERVITHLIDNAIKFTEEGSVTITVDTEGAQLRLQVADTGVGIDEGFHPFLFEAFKQESSGMTRSYAGAGLGLSICKRMVTLMGGDLTCESKKHCGSRFEIILPEVVSVEHTTGVSPTGTPPARSRPRLLTVEDSPEIILLLEHMLESDFELDTAKNEDEALTLAHLNQYDLVLLDINLGRQRTGVDVLGSLRAIPAYADVPVVAMTAHALFQDRERFLEAGFNGYLSKPFSTTQVHAVIQQMLKESNGWPKLKRAD